MDEQALAAALATLIPEPLARDLARQFGEIRHDVASQTLGRAAPGKFVESVVQALQAVENGGQYDAQPKVDEYLRGLESRPSVLPDGLRICAARLARAMYAIRSKRSIVHKADVDPSLYDLRLLHVGAQWIISELLSLASGITGETAGRLVAQAQLPVGELVETLDERKIVHAELTVRDEALVLLATHYPEPIPQKHLVASMDRRNAGSVANAVRALWREKLVHKTADGLLVLTQAGLLRATEIARNSVA